MCVYVSQCPCPNVDLTFSCTVYGRLSISSLGMSVYISTCNTILSHACNSGVAGSITWVCTWWLGGQFRSTLHLASLRLQCAKYILRDIRWATYYLCTFFLTSTYTEIVLLLAWMNLLMFVVLLELESLTIWPVIFLTSLPRHTKTAIDASKIPYKWRY